MASPPLPSTSAQPEMEHDPRKIVIGRRAHVSKPPPHSTEDLRKVMKFREATKKQEEGLYERSFDTTAQKRKAEEQSSAAQKQIRDDEGGSAIRHRMMRLLDKYTVFHERFRKKVPSLPEPLFVGKKNSESYSPGEIRDYYVLEREYQRVDCDEMVISHLLLVLLSATTLTTFSWSFVVDLKVDDFFSGKNFCCSFSRRPNLT